MTERLPLVDDWDDQWDYMAVLRDNNVTVEWCDSAFDSEGREHPVPEPDRGYSFSWQHGAIFIGRVTEDNAFRAAALFITLWLRGFSASFADKLMDGYLTWLEIQHTEILGFVAELNPNHRCLHFSRKAFCLNAEYRHIESALISRLDLQPDEEVVVTFTKRKKWSNVLRGC